MTEWHIIATAPKEGAVIDLWVSGPRNDGSRITDCWWSTHVNAWVFDAGRDGICEAKHYVDDVVTHWMLPPRGPTE